MVKEKTERRLIVIMGNRINVIKKNSKFFLFVLTFLCFLIWIYSKKSMILNSGDAADIWKTITSYYSDECYLSYVMYKGIASVYPYVWLYQLSCFLGINEFFFIMVFHALLFSYITTIGIPYFISTLLRCNPLLWQRILLPIFLFLIWRPTSALDQLMVDLPSCAIFVMTLCIALYIEKCQGRKRLVLVGISGVLCGYCANISGQYSLAAVCVLIYILVKYVLRKSVWERKSVVVIASILLISMSMFVTSEMNIRFHNEVVKPLNTKNIPYLEKEYWMNRALICMMDINRLSYYPVLSCKQGEAIVCNLYGEEQGKEAIERAKDGMYEWTPSEYLGIVARYPTYFLIQYIDRIFISLSLDMGCQSLAFLIMGYTLLYLTILTVLKRITQIKTWLHAESWLIIAVFASIIPVLVMTVEMRYVLSFQGVTFGCAILGPVLPGGLEKIRLGLKQCWREKSILRLENKEFPWPFAIGVVFVVCCITHMSALYAQSGLGVEMLIH